MFNIIRRITGVLLNAAVSTHRTAILKHGEQHKRRSRAAWARQASQAKVIEAEKAYHRELVNAAVAVDDAAIQHAVQAAEELAALPPKRV